jgi:hypothetical protein
MARNCPKNTSRQVGANAHEATTTADTTNATTSTTVVAATTTAPPTTTTTPPIATPPRSTLTKAQQIRALEESMNDEERGTYLDARDMGEDFCGAEF